MTLAMEMSLAEEEARKQLLKEQEEAEDEALKLALEASLQLAKEESLKSDAEISQIEAEEAFQEPFKHVEEVKEGPPLVSQRSQQQSSEFRINKKKKLHLNLPKH